jgi:DNA (cytosine-5)-methyltransferase 1
MTSIASLCSGYGGLDLAAHAVFGGDLTWVADIDPGASAILAHRFPSVPNIGDIKAADWSTVDSVDVLTAGFPCQDISCAGRRAGLREGNRTGVWSYVARAIGELRPSLVVLENVRGLLSAGADSDMEPCPWCLGDSGDEHALRALGAVLGDLADLGFDAEWTLVSAADAGAPHRRERVFVLAWPAQDANGTASSERRQSAPGQAPGGRSRADARRPGGASAPADADGTPGGRHEPGSGPRPLQGAAVAERAPQQPRRLHSGSGSEIAMAPADPGRPRLGEHAGEPPAEEAGTLAGDEPSGDRRLRPAPDWGPYGPAIARWEAVTGRQAPRPTEPGRTGERLSPRFVEWMQGLPDGWVTDVPGLSRNAQLKALGNGVVPAQAELALRLLLDRAALATDRVRAVRGAA